MRESVRVETDRGHFYPSLGPGFSRSSWPCSFGNYTKRIANDPPLISVLQDRTTGQRLEIRRGTGFSGGLENPTLEAGGHSSHLNIERNRQFVTGDLADRTTRLLHSRASKASLRLRDQIGFRRRPEGFELRFDPARTGQKHLELGWPQMHRPPLES